MNIKVNNLKVNKEDFWGKISQEYSNYFMYQINKFDNSNMDTSNQYYMALKFEFNDQVSMMIHTLHYYQILAFASSTISFMYVLLKIIIIGISLNYKNHQALTVQNYEIENQIDESEETLQVSERILSSSLNTSPKEIENENRHLLSKRINKQKQKL